jgi:hypothetical protein
MTVLNWEGGEHSFKLGIGQLRALQAATDVGPLFLLGRIAGSQWFVDDIIETVRLGLIGGGMTEIEAKRLVDRVFIENTPSIYRGSLLAVRILRNAVTGEPDDPVGAEGERKRRTKTRKVV